MISNWHKATFRKPTAGRKSQTDIFPDVEKSIQTILPAIDAGESAKAALMRIFNVSECNRFTDQVIRDQRVIKAMMKRALKFNIQLSPYYKKAKEEQQRGRL